MELVVAETVESERHHGVVQTTDVRTNLILTVSLNIVSLDSPVLIVSCVFLDKDTVIGDNYNVFFNWYHLHIEW